MVEQSFATATERGLATLSRIDYEDAFLVTIDPADDRTAEQWARAMLEGAPVAVRRRLRRGWQALGLQLAPVASEAPAILGWGIRHQTPHTVLLGADSRLGMAGELLFTIDGKTLVFATFAQHTNPVIRWIWGRLVSHHLRVVTQLLRRAQSDTCRPQEEL